MKILPFFEHPGEGRCFQACLKAVLKVLQPEKDYDYDELDEITGRPRGDFGTWPVKPAIELSKMGFYVKYYSGLNPQRFINEGMGYLVEILPVDLVGRIQRETYSEAKRLAPLMLEKDLFEHRVVDFDFLLEEIEKDRYPILMIATAPFTGKITDFGEHYVVMLGLEGEYVYIHDSARICHGKISKSLFSLAFKPLPCLNEAFVIGQMQE